MHSGRAYAFSSIRLPESSRSLAPRHRTGSASRQRSHRASRQQDNTWKRGCTHR
jgi:hypothetical protein